VFRGILYLDGRQVQIVSQCMNKNFPVCYISAIRILHSIIDIICHGNLIAECMLNTQEWQDGNTANVCTFLVALASDTVNIFLLCYIGEHITATVSLSCVYIYSFNSITFDFSYIVVLSFPSRAENKILHK